MAEVKFSVDFDAEGNVIDVRAAKQAVVTKKETPGMTADLQKLIHENGFDKFEVKTTSILNLYTNPICSVVIGGRVIYYVC
jgi:hypothetical protein